MFNKLDLFIAIRYFSGRKDKFISVVSLFGTIGIALGVATLIIVMSVMNGYEIELINRILGINGQLAVTNQNYKIKEYNQLTKEIKQVNGVKYAAPILIGQGLASVDKNSMGVMIRGMTEHDLKNKPIMQTAIKEGRVSGFDNNYDVIIGVSLAEKLGVGIGDEIKIIAPKASATVAGLIPRMKTFRVVAVFDVGMYEYNASTIFMPLSKAQIFLEYYDAVSEIEVITYEGVSLKKIKNKIFDLVSYPLVITDWGMANESLMNALRVERNTMFLILMLIIMIAAFNIVSSLIMLVKEKYKNTAILRTLGATKASIVRIFMICGLVQGFNGTIIGASIGLLFVLNIDKIKMFLESISGLKLFDPVVYFLTTIPAKIDYPDVCIIIITSLVLSLISSIYPAFRAAKTIPAEALRSE